MRLLCKCISLRNDKQLGRKVPRFSLKHLAQRVLYTCFVQCSALDRVHSLLPPPCSCILTHAVGDLRKIHNVDDILICSLSEQVVLPAFHISVCATQCYTFELTQNQKVSVLGVLGGFYPICFAPQLDTRSWSKGSLTTMTRNGER